MQYKLLSLVLGTTLLVNSHCNCADPIDAEAEQSPTVLRHGGQFIRFEGQMSPKEQQDLHRGRDTAARQRPSSAKPQQRDSDEKTGTAQPRKSHPLKGCKRLPGVEPASTELQGDWAKMAQLSHPASDQ